MATATENRIENMKLKLNVLEDRIGRLMTQRADMEDKLADLYEKRSAERARG